MRVCKCGGTIQMNIIYIKCMSSCVCISSKIKVIEGIVEILAMDRMS